MPATATYNPLTSQNLAYVIRADTRDTRRFADAPRPSPPLKGLRETRAATVSYRASVPSGHAGCEVASYQASSLYGETLSFEIKGSPSALPQSIPNSEFLIPNWTYTFSAKEKDSETGLSYFGSRYYSSDLSIWLSVDPMSDKYASLSPYVYCADNPVKLVDPNGEEIGNYYDINGNIIGSDCNDDGKIYLVSNQQGITKDEKGNIVILNPVDVHELPDKTTRGQIIDQLLRNDLDDPNSESGGCYGADWNQHEQKFDNYHVEWGETRHYDPPCDVTEMKYPQVSPLNFKVLFDFHSHGTGVCKVVGSDFENVWDQQPGRIDRQNSSTRATIGRTFAAFGMRFEKIYFYNENGVYATWSFNQFRNN